jgi:hypothetical protein
MSSWEPVLYEGESAILNPKAMAAGEPYPFLLAGVWLVAIKGDDDSIDVYVGEAPADAHE